MNTTTAFRGMSRTSVAAIISPEAMVRVSQVTHAEMIFGTHHVWEHGAMLYTEEGLRLAVDRLRETHPGDALALQAEAGRRIAAAGPREPLPVGEIPPATPDASFWWQRY